MHYIYNSYKKNKHSDRWMDVNKELTEEDQVQAQRSFYFSLSTENMKWKDEQWTMKKWKQ